MDKLILEIQDTLKKNAIDELSKVTGELYIKHGNHPIVTELNSHVNTMISEYQKGRI